MKYRKRPVVVDAFKLGTDYIPDWFADKITDNTVTLHGTSTGFYDGHDTNADINTLEGVMHANYGDYIIRGINGELYPCKPDIFAATYEPVEDEHHNGTGDVYAGTGPCGDIYDGTGNGGELEAQSISKTEGGT